MTTRTAQEAKEEIRQAVDIVQVVGERVPLRRAGRTWKGLCPFHAEKTPSFTVNPERQIWHCFGCNRGGDVFAFLMEIDKVTFPEALQALADRTGIELPQGGRAVAGDARRDRLYQANALANDFFKASLLTEAGARAREYVAARGFQRAILERFQVGWAPAGWDGLVSALSKLLPGPVLEEAGLTLRRGDGTSYDRFRNRITFPIETTSGRVAGFGARAVDPEDTPKYLNSPESAIYRKGSLLFGLPPARPAIRERKQVLVGEGYLDVLRMHEAGFAHAVSTCGTALTLDQARVLARFEADVVLVYDGDDAGIRAADRALDPLLQAGLSVRVLLLPEGEDPDSYLARNGAKSFGDLLESAGDPALFLSSARTSGGPDPSAEARVRRYVELLGRVGDPIRRRLMVRRGSAVFGIEEEVLLEALSRRRGGAGGSSRPGAAAPRPSSATGAQAEAGSSRGRPGSAPGVGSDPAPAGEGEKPEDIDPVEKELAARCLTEEGAVLEVAERGGVNCFRSKSLQRLLQSWITMGRAPLPEELRALEEMEPVARALLLEHPVEEGRTDEASRRGARELLSRIEERRLRRSIHELDRAIRAAEGSRDAESLGRLVAERRDLASKLHSHNASELQGRTYPAAS